MSVSRRLGRRECFDLLLFWRLWDAGNCLLNEGYNQRAPLRDIFFAKTLLIFRKVRVDGFVAYLMLVKARSAINSSSKPVPC